MRLTVIIEMDLERENETPLRDREPAERAAIHATAAIQNRLFGEGFLPDDVLVESWNVRTEICERQPKGN